MTWVVTTVAGALATILSGGVADLWSRSQDTWADVRDRPVIEGVAYSPINGGQRYAFTEAISGGPGRRLLREDAGRDDLIALVKAKKGYRLGQMDISIVVRGMRHEPVRILDVRPHIISVKPPPSGTCFSIPTAGGDGVFPIDVDLDHPSPGYGTKHPRDRFLKKNINLVYGERATIEVTAHAEKRSYDWEIQIDYLQGDGTSVEHAYVRDERGEPFRLSGWARRYRYIYEAAVLTEDFRLSRSHTKC
ncbi:hypothetical protein [Microbispora bryophytorum]|nr:hypothetical protein [Microbispora bryophytorum]MBD3135692.1 hypothetical protein [Microbispora bryophytorum]TQS09859.1 hypothetical protein FLX07_02010 [Microbispora bryophytorum]